MPGCVLRFCKNSSRNVNKSTGITFHRFLCADHKRREAWIKFVQNERNEDTWSPSEHSYICSAHFEESDFRYTKTGRKYLKKDALPYHPFLTSENSGSIASSSLDQESVFDSPETLKLKKDLLKVTAAKQLLIKKNRKITRQNKQLKKKQENLTDIIKTIRRKIGIDSRTVEILLERAEIAEMYTNIRHKVSNQTKIMKYSPAIRKFALYCNYYSPAAYKHIRKQFYTSLPHPRLVTKWYSTVNAAPGFTGEAFRILKLKCDRSSTPVICNLVFGEMSLKKKKLFKNKALANVNFGRCPVEENEEEVATQVLVFMLVSLTENWKIPVAYFLAAGISAQTKASLVNICLMKCHDVGVTVCSLTFDGCPVNFQAAEILGCDFKNACYMKTFFSHPSTSENICIFIDPFYCIKLIRNTFENKKIIYDDEENPIQWQLLVNLNKLKQNQSLNFDNKPSLRHIHFRNQIMKIKVATQLLSSSVAKALVLCDQVLKSSKFRNSAPTVNFINIINDLFDIFNSQICHFNYYKKPLDDKNKEDIFTFLENAKKYILSLGIQTKKRRIINLPNRDPRIVIQISKQRIVETQNKAGFIGAIICIESLKTIFYQLVIDQCIIKSLSSYRISLDHLELFFGSIQRYHSNNDNPNVLEFRAAYKKILSHLVIKSNLAGNCIPLDNFTMLNTSSIDVINNTSIMSRHDEEEFVVLENEALLDSDIQAKVNCQILTDRLNTERFLTSAMKFVVGYISGYVARQLTDQLKCEICITGLTTEVRLWHHKLIVLKDMGGLCYSSLEVYEICLRTEKNVRLFTKEHGRDQRVIARYSHINFIVARTLKSFVNSNMFDFLISHALQQPCTLNHRNHIIRAIIEKYAQIRLNYESKIDPEKRHITKSKNFTKLILFPKK